MAYNILFDLHAIHTTDTFMFTGKLKDRDENGVIIPNKNSRGSNGTFFNYVKGFVNSNIAQKKMEYLCLYGMVVKKLLDCDEYVKAAVTNKWFSEAGNISTGAEFAYKFLINNPDYEEPHTALEDSEIEVALFNAAQKLPGDYTDEIIYTPYRIIKRRFQKMQLEGAV